MGKILLIDDEVKVREVCREALMRAGHDVTTVARGDQVFETLRNEKPDLVIMDIEVPGEEGLSLLRRMPNAPKNRVPVVIYSGKVTAETEKAAFEAGALEVIRKGSTPVELTVKIGKILKAKPRLLGETASSEKEKILIVDDEEKIRNILSEFFTRKGFKTVCAPNGETAIQAVRAEKPDVILLDMMMPGMDGLVTLKKIREIDPDAGVVMATGVQDEQIAREAIALGAYHYVLKPFDMKYLEMVVLTRLLIAGS